MGYRIALAPSARGDLRDIVRYISLDSPDRAIAFGQFLVGSIRRLGDFPEMGRIVPEFDDPAIREIVVRTYRVIYRLDLGARRVEVIRFWHAARGKPDILARYAANRLRVVRQVHYSLHNENSLDLVFFLNGGPVATVELKTRRLCRLCARPTAVHDL